MLRPRTKKVRGIRPGTAIPAAIVFLLLLCAGAHPGYAQQISVTAAVNQTTVEMDESIIYTIRIESSSTLQVRPPDPPETQGLTLLRSRPSTRRNISIVNGRFRQRVTFQWRFRPDGGGTARIGPAKVRVDESYYTTDPIEITVSAAASAQNRSSGQAASNSNENVFIRAYPSKTDVFVNEQVTVAYELYFREGYEVQNSRMAAPWKANGFWREELEVDPYPVPESVVIDGIRYNKFTLKRAAFFPTRSGSLQIAPLEIESQILRPFQRGNFFNFRLRRGKRLHLVDVSSPPVTVRVHPMPDGAPPTFRGAVGSFSIDQTINRTRLQAGEAVELSVTVSGIGNIATLAEPVLKLPDSFEKYDPQVSKDIDRRGRRIRGEKTFTYVIIPRRPGSYTIPPVVMTYYDPSTETYVTRSTNSIELEITPSATTPNVVSTNESLPADDIAGIMTGPGLDAINPTPLHRQAWPYAGMGLPVAALLGLWGYRRWRRKWALAAKRNHATAQSHLTRAHTLRRQGKAEPFYEEIERAIRAFISVRTGIEAHGLTKEALDGLLQDLNVPPQLREELQQLLNECERACFSPFSPDPKTMETAAERTKEFLSTLDGMLETSTHRSVS